MPAKVPPCPVELEVFDEVEEPVEVVELIVLRLFAIREMDGPASANNFVFDSVPLYWISNGNCQRLPVVCSKLRLTEPSAELTIA
jgi:hypothetical protein